MFQVAVNLSPFACSQVETVSTYHVNMLGGGGGGGDETRSTSSSLQSTLSKRTLSKPDSKFGPFLPELHLYLCNGTLSSCGETDEDNCVTMIAFALKALTWTPSNRIRERKKIPLVSSRSVRQPFSC